MLNDLVEQLKAFFFWIIDYVFDFLHYCFYFFFDLLCDLAELAISAVSIPGELITGMFQWADLPGPALYVLSHLGLSTGLSMIVAALTVRLLLNLIPSWASRV